MTDLKNYISAQEDLNTVYSMIMKLHGDVLEKTAIQDLTDRVRKRMIELNDFKKKMKDTNEKMIADTVAVLGVTEEEVIGTLIVFDLVVANVYYEERIKSLLKQGDK